MRGGVCVGSLYAGSELRVEAETVYGCLVLGAVVPETLDPQAVSAVMDAMVLVASLPDEE